MRFRKSLCMVWLICLLLTQWNSVIFAAELGTSTEQDDIKRTVQLIETEADKNPMGEKETELPSTEPETETQPMETQTEDFNNPEEGQSTVSIKIDNQNVYEGMTRAYKKGYQPVVEKNQATIVIPLLCDGKVKKNCLTASVELGNTENSPFVYRTYEKNFRLKTEKINGTKDTKDVFLISFALDLQKKRQNGIYPVTIQIKGVDENNNEILQTFTSYVVITDGIDANDAAGQIGGDTGGGEEIPTSAPIVLISNSTLGTDTVKAGEDFKAVVTLKNTSTQKSVQNMVVTVQVPSSDMELKNESNTIFVGKLGTEKTTDITLQFHVNKSIAEGNYPIEIAMSYDDPKANTINSSGVFMVTVEQPLSLEMTMPMIQKEMTVGDTIPLTFQVMNLGRSKVYNVRCDVEGNGLTQTKTAFIGNMESGTEGESSLNLFVSSMEGEKAYGQTRGTVILTYEDGFGHEQSQNYPFETTILEKSEISQSPQENETESASQWWISIGTLVGILIIMGCSLGVYFLNRRKK